VTTVTAAVTAVAMVTAKEAETEPKTNGRRRVVAGRIPVCGYWLVTVAIIVRRGDNTARETGRKRED
jgi:hypothetical protein